MRGKATIPPVMFPVSFKLQFSFGHFTHTLPTPHPPASSGVMASLLPFTSFLVGKLWGRQGEVQ